MNGLNGNLQNQKLNLKFVSFKNYIVSDIYTARYFFQPRKKKTRGKNPKKLRENQTCFWTTAEYLQNFYFHINLKKIPRAAKISKFMCFECSAIVFEFRPCILYIWMRTVFTRMFIHLTKRHFRKSLWHFSLSVHTLTFTLITFNRANFFYRYFRRYTLLYAWNAHTIQYLSINWTDDMCSFYG